MAHTHTHLHLAWGLGWALPAGVFVLCMCVPEGAQCLWVTLCVTCVPVDVTIQATSSNVGATVLIVALMGLQCVCGIHALVAHGCP